MGAAARAGGEAYARACLVVDASDRHHASRKEAMLGEKISQTWPLSRGKFGTLPNWGPLTKATVVAKVSRPHAGMTPRELPGVCTVSYYSGKCY